MKFIMLSDLVSYENASFRFHSDHSDCTCGYEGLTVFPINVDAVGFVKKSEVPTTSVKIGSQMKPWLQPLVETMENTPQSMFMDSPHTGQVLVQTELTHF